MLRIKFDRDGDRLIFAGFVDAEGEPIDAEERGMVRWEGDVMIATGRAKIPVFTGVFADEKMISEVTEDQ